MPATTVSPETAEQYQSILAAIDAARDSQLTLLHGIIREYDSATHSVRCDLLPQLGDNPERLGFIRLHTPWVGDGWGAKFAPKLGSQVIIIALGQPVEALFAVASLFDANGNVPPAEHLNDGEAIIRHQSGTYIKFQADGTIYIHSDESLFIDADSDIAVTVGGNLNATVKGTTEISCDSAILLSSSDIILGDDGAFPLARFVDLAVAFDAHTHASSGSGVPNTPLNPLIATTKVRGT